MLWNEASALVCLPQSMFEIMFEQSWGKNYNVRPRQILSCPAQLFSQLTIELVKRNSFEWLRQDQFTSFHDITNWYFMNSGQDYKVLLFSSWHQKSCFMCVLTLCEWLIIWFDLKTNSKQQLFYKIFCIKSNQKNVRRLSNLYCIPIIFTFSIVCTAYVTNIGYFSSLLFHF